VRARFGNDHEAATKQHPIEQFEQIERAALRPLPQGDA
jgi:hypothetical protein